MVGLLGDLRRAAELQEQTLTGARRLGVTSFIRWQEAENAIHAYWQGRWADALLQANDFIDATEAGSPHYMDSVCRYVRGSIYLARGDIEGALADARRGTEQARPVKDPQALNPAVAFEARVEVAAGNLEVASRLADELLAIWGRDGVGPQVELVDGAWALVDLGRADELVAAIGTAQAQTLWHQAATRIAAGDAAAAAEVYAEIGALPEELYARLRAADDLVRRRAARGSRCPAEAGVARHRKARCDGLAGGGRGVTSGVSLSRSAGSSSARGRASRGPGCRRRAAAGPGRRAPPGRSRPPRRARRSRRR